MNFSMFLILISGRFLTYDPTVQSERWMGSDHAHPEGIPKSPRAKDDTYCMTAIYYQDPFLDSFDSHVDMQTMLEYARS